MFNVAPAELTTSAPLTNEATKEELFERAKAAVEAGELSMREAAEALHVAQELHGVSQAEMALAVGKSEAWVSRLLAWRRKAFREESPFGPTTKAARLAHAKGRAAGGRARRRKPNAECSVKADEVAQAGSVVPMPVTAGSFHTVVDPRNADDDVLLANFKYAVDIWLPGMSEEAKRQAVSYVLESAGVRPS